MARLKRSLLWVAFPIICSTGVYHGDTGVVIGSPRFLSVGVCVAVAATPKSIKKYCPSAEQMALLGLMSR